MSNETEQEIWKIFPEYDFIEVSNLGRVRTKDRTIIDKNGRKRFVKGRVLKQQPHPNGYMYVDIHTNGKRVHLLVHRMVAITFIPNVNNYLEVNHKDNNPKNNAVSNLEWCTRQYNIDFKKNFGTTSAQVLGHPVYAVNLETGEVFYFKSRSEAARQLGVSQGQIWWVLKGQQYMAGNYWLTGDESEITEEKIQEIKAKIRSHQVIAINQDTGEVFWFKTQTEAARQLGVDNSNISAVINGRLNTTGGFWFCYADENAIEKVREKFGDEIAKKVEELIKHK